jgi:hypothetical protein
MYRIGAFVVSFMFAATMILTPPQIRPAGYNQLPPSLQQIVEAQQQHQQQLRPGRNSHALLDDGVQVGELEALATAEGNVSSLMLFVVFHRLLHDDLYSDLSVPHAQLDVTKSSGENASTLLLNRGVTFVATNPSIPKTINGNNPLYRNRIVNEWETPGYDACFGSMFNEFGAMNSIYCSDWTLAGAHACHPGEGPRSDEGASDVLDTSFVGVLQYDMRIDTTTLSLIRRRILNFRKRRLDKRWGGRAMRLKRQQAALGGADNNNNGAAAGALEVRPHGPQAASANSAGGIIRAANEDLGIRLSPKHRILAKQKSIDAAMAAQAGLTRCCIFYAVTHPTKFLLAGPVGKSLLAEYNRFYGTAKTLNDASPIGVLDGFVLPYSDFNSLMEFLRVVIRRLAVTAPEVGTSPAGAPPTVGNTSCVARPLTEAPSVAPLDVLEKATALWLALVDDVEFVAMPVKHQKLT